MQKEIQGKLLFLFTGTWKQTDFPWFAKKKVKLSPVFVICGIFLKKYLTNKALFYFLIYLSATFSVYFLFFFFVIPAWPD